MKKLLLALVASVSASTLLTGCSNSVKKTSETEAQTKVKQNENKQVEKKQPENKPDETTSQKNAVKKAEQYLTFMAFSEKGLIKQLEFDKFSKEDATYAVKNIKVDWNDQAVKKGKTYLDVSAFSKDGLIKQLEFDGFTHEQAMHGAAKNGL